MKRFGSALAVVAFGALTLGATPGVAETPPPGGGLQRPDGNAGRTPAEVAEDVRQAAIAAAPQDPSPEAVPGQILVRYKAGTSRSMRAASADAADVDVVDESTSSPVVLVETSPDSVDSAIEELDSDPAVESADLNYVRTADYVPSDPLWSQQSQALSLIRAPQAWDLTRSSTSVRVGVLDSGIDLDHPDLAGRIGGAESFVPGEGAADTLGHGTAVAGVIAANASNGQGISGVAPNARIYSLKVFNAAGTTTDAILWNALERAASLDLDVVNLSLSGSGYSDALGLKIHDLINAGTVVVASAGNAGVPFPQYPAAYRGVVAVGATDATGDPAFFSNHGPWLSVVAPGINIRSTKLTAGSGGTYDAFTGTSFAAPLVSGVAALRARPSRTIANGHFKAYDLLRTAQDRGIPGFDTSYGYGIIDAFAALGAGQVPTPTPNPTTGDTDGTIDRATVIGAHATSAISPPSDEDWFAFDVQDESRLEVTVTPPALGTFRTREMDPAVEIYDPQQQLVAFEDSETTGVPEVAGADAVPGRYYIRVGNFHGSASPAPYSIDITTGGPYVGDSPSPQQGGAWVRTTTPRNGADGVSRTANLTVQSYRDLAGGTVNADSVWLIEGRSGEPVDGAVSFSAATDTITFNPAATLLPSTPYTLVIGGVTDTGMEDMPLVLVGLRTAGGARPGVSVSGTYLPVTGDFNGDEATDILWYGNGGTNAQWLGGTTGFRSLGTFGGWPSGLRPRLFDWDGDRYDDLLVYHPTSTTTPDYVIPGGDRGDIIGGYFQRSSPYIPLTGDFDGDGFEDLFWYGPGTAKDEIWFGGEVPTRKRTVSLSGTYRPVVGDFNGDFIDDVFWHGPGSAGDYMWRFSPTGHTSIAYSISGSYQVFAGDFTGNGFDDIFFYAPGTAGDSFWHFAKSGRTSRSVTVNGTTYRPAIGDFDADGFDDLMLYAPGTATDTMWWGTTTGARSL